MNIVIRFIMILSVVSMLLLQSAASMSLVVRAQQFYSIAIADIYLSNDRGQRVYDVAPGDTLYLNIVLTRETPGDNSQITGAVSIQPLSDYIKPYPSKASFIIPFTSSKQIDVITLSTKIFIDNSTSIGSYITLNIVLRYAYPTNIVSTVYYTYTIVISGRPSIAIHALQQEVEPGFQRIDLIISNQGALAATDIQISIVPPQQGVYLFNSSMNILSIGTGESIDMPIYVYIPQTIQNSIIQLQIQTSFTSSMGTPYEEVIQIPLRVVAPNKQILDVKASTAILMANSLNNISLTITNLGPYNIRSLNISLSSQQLGVVGGTYFSLGSININSSATLQLLIYAPYVDSITQAQLIVNAIYRDEYLRDNSAQFVLQFYVVPQQMNRVSIYVDNSYIVSPGINTICISVRSATPIRNLTIYISSPQGVQLNTTVLNLGNLAPGISRISCLSIYTFTPISGSLILPITTIYNDDHGLTYQERSNIVLHSYIVKPSIIARLEGSNIIYSGSPAEVNIRVMNSGLLDVYNTTISISIQSGNIVKIEPQVVTIPSLTVNSSIPIPINILLAPTTSTSIIPIVLQISYYDSYANYYTSTQTLYIVVLPSSASSVIPLVAVYPNTIKALNNETLTICIANPLSATLSNAQLSISLPQQLLAINRSNVVYLGDIPENSSVCISIPIVVANQPGIYRLGIQLSYVYNLAYWTQQYEYTVKIQPIAIGLDVFTDQQILSSPSSSNITLAIKNVGEVPIYKVSLTFTSSSSQLVLGLTSRNIDSIPPGGSVSIDIPVICIASSPTTAMITVSTQYLDAIGASYTYSKSIAIRITPNVTYPNINIYAKTLTAGSNNTIVVSIVNSGGSSLLNAYLSLSISPSSILIVNGSPIQIGYIDPKSVKNIPITIYVPSDISSSAATISATLTYLDSQLNIQNSISTQIPVTIQVIPNIIVVDQSVIPQTVSIGGMFTISLTIMNTGPGGAYQLRIYPNISILPIRVISQSTVYIGTLSQDRSASASFTFMLLNITGFNATFTRTFTGTFTPRYPSTTVTEIPRTGTVTPRVTGFGGFIRIPIVVEFNDNLRNIHRNIIYVEVQVSQQSSTRTIAQTLSGFSSSGNQLWLAVALGVVVIGVIGILVVRLRRGGR